jgi:predicted Co/Zn/Cd cation transporter (cation efflux family)
LAGDNEFIKELQRRSKEKKELAQKVRWNVRCSMWCMDATMEMCIFVFFSFSCIVALVLWHSSSSSCNNMIHPCLLLRACIIITTTPTTTTTTTI